MRIRMLKATGNDSFRGLGGGPLTPRPPRFPGTTDLEER
jgi:hypothetical protein